MTGVTARPVAYLDCNATMPVRPEAAEAVLRALRVTGNPSSVHGPGRAARRLLEAARTTVAAAVGASPDNVIFTSGGTEANNMALAGGGSVIVSAVEHASVLSAVPEPLVVPVEADGRVNLAVLEDMTASHCPRIVSVMAANNETGVLQPVADVAAIARRHGALFHVDAIQALGKIPVSMHAYGCDLLSLSAHKLGGPAGIGALVVRDGVDVPTLLRGGAQEARRRAGTPNLPGIAGLAAAVGACSEADAVRMAALRDAMEMALAARWPQVRFIGGGVPRLPNTSCILMRGVSAETQLMALDLDGIAVSAGAACSSGKIAPSHVLLAMGLPPEEARAAIRVSLGWATTAEEIDRFVAAWVKLAERTAPKQRARVS